MFFVFNFPIWKEKNTLNSLLIPSFQTLDVYQNTGGNTSKLATDSCFSYRPLSLATPENSKLRSNEEELVLFVSMDLLATNNAR